MGQNRQMAGVRRPANAKFFLPPPKSSNPGIAVVVYPGITGLRPQINRPVVTHGEEVAAVGTLAGRQKRHSGRNVHFQTQKHAVVGSSEYVHMVAGTNA